VLLGQAQFLVQEARWKVPHGYVLEVLLIFLSLEVLHSCPTGF